MLRLVDAFHKLVLNFLRSLNRWLLLTLDRSENTGINEGPALKRVVLLLMLGLFTIYNSTASPDSGRKVTLSHRGHSDLRDCIRDIGVTELTDRATRKTCICKQLAMALEL